MEISQTTQKYFDWINERIKESYDLAKKAKAKGFDPVDTVEIPLTKNMAERVEGLISIAAPQIVGKGIPDRIFELEKEFGKLDWRVAFSIALEVANQKFCKFEDERKAMEVGIRVGIAYVTVGVVASPLEGFTELKIRERKDGKKYFAMFFSGPIRSAGGTGASVSVLIGDYIRKKMGYDVYDPDEQEVKRFFTELRDYHERVTNLQYYPSEEETEFFMKNCPVQIDGDPSDKREVSNYKDLKRVETNRIRSGVCLVVGEGLTQKAPKVWKQISKWGKDFGMDHWNFLDKFIKIQKKVKSRGEMKKDDEILPSDYTYIKDIVAGRPVLSYPLAKGGLRLRYGRSRLSGLSSMAIHPATMEVLDSFIATGTQLKVERPSKGTALSVCDNLEGPIVKLKSGEVVFIEDSEQAREYKREVDEILFLGDMLVSYGDFLNRAHVLVPPGYCEEWWIKEVEKAGKNPEQVANISGVDLPLVKKLFDDPIKTKINAENAIKISESLHVPLHPKYTFHWKDISHKEFLALIGWLGRGVVKKNDYFKVILPISYKIEEEGIDPKRVLEILGVPHKIVTKEHVVIEGDWAKAFMVNLGCYKNDLNVERIIKSVDENKEVLDIVNDFSEVRIKDKSGVYIGARMGRPEKGKMRKLTGSPHVLFPVGEEGGRLRCFQSALEVGRVNSQFPIFHCKKCNEETVYPVCDVCGEKTEKRYYCGQCAKLYETEDCPKHGKNMTYKYQDLDICKHFELAKKKLKLNNMPNLIKGVRGTSNEDHTPEHLIKGILRAIHSLGVNKDGTVRFDMTELAITHFKPKEIGTSVEKLKELGYEKDIYDNVLENEDQILELKAQDVILPRCEGSDEDGADVILYRISKFIDDCLKHLYGLNNFYNLKNKEDLVGHLVIALAPHTSAGITGRIIGFSNVQGFYAHPLLHCAVRRDVDGDECCVMLLMDALLNFSRKFLPTHRGAVQDAPLVLTSNLLPSEVDDMIFDMDTAWTYPLEFYEACEKYKMPWDFHIENVGDRLGTEKQFEGYGFTHDVTDLNCGNNISAYKFLPTMMEKVQGQMRLAEKIRAVRTGGVAALVIERHFIRDIKGNLRKFSMQQFRCVNCNEKFRRPPLMGKCLKCGGRIIFTISEGSVIKYLKPSIDLANKYDLPTYLKQTLEITQQRIDDVFGKDPEKQEGLGKWF